MTWGEGKVKTIEKYLAAKKGYGPILTAGDSDGDFNMLSQIDSVKLGLIINRNKKGKIGSLYDVALKENNVLLPRYILQGRNEIDGCFDASETTG